MSQINVTAGTLRINVKRFSIKSLKYSKLFQPSADFVGGFVMHRRKAGEWRDGKTETILRRISD